MTVPSYMMIFNFSFPCSIEYGDMQLICEAYNLMKDTLGMSHDEMAATLSDWNKGELDSFLIEISANILKYKDTDGLPLVEKIRDAAGQKGTGKWTAISALEYGMPVTLIGESVFARCLSSIKSERVRASGALKGPEVTIYDGNKKAFVEDIRKALYASKIVSYAQGFMLLREAANVFGWKLNYGGIGKGNKNVFSKHQIALRSIFKNLIEWEQDLKISSNGNKI